MVVGVYGGWERKGVWDAISFWVGGSRRTALSAADVWCRDGNLGGKGSKHLGEARLVWKSEFQVLLFRGFPRFKLETGKISGWKGQEVAVGSVWLFFFFPFLSLSTHTPRIQRGLVF